MRGLVPRSDYGSDFLEGSPGVHMSPSGLALTPRADTKRDSPRTMRPLLESHGPCGGEAFLKADCNGSLGGLTCAGTPAKASTSPCPSIGYKGARYDWLRPSGARPPAYHQGNAQTVPSIVEEDMDDFCEGGREVEDVDWEEEDVAWEEERS